MIPPRIKKIKILKDYIIQIFYINGEVKFYNMERKLDCVFYKNLKNKEYFKLARSVETTIEWPNGEDIDPNDLYENAKDLN